MSIIGSIFGGISRAHAATKAADAQVAGAQQAQGQIAQGQEASQDFLNNEFTSNTQNQAPFIELGGSSANALTRFLQTPFQAPTEAEVQATPGYQFTRDQGIDALDKSAAARGNLFSGTQGTDLEKYATGLADQTYNDAYNRALNTYMTNYQTLLGGAQLGEGAASTLGYQGNQAASLNTGINLGGSEAQAQQINNAAAARASGYVGRSNAYSNMANEIGNAFEFSNLSMPWGL